MLSEKKKKFLLLKDLRYIIYPQKTLHRNQFKEILLNRSNLFP